MSPDLPAALVQQGTTPQQKVYTGTLATLPSIAEKYKPKPPTLIIVGEVVELRDKLNWYKSAQDASEETLSFEPGAWPEAEQVVS